MPFPSAGPTTLDLVKAQLKITDTVDDEDLEDLVVVVNDVVKSMRIAQAANVDPAPADWDAWPRVIKGATMLAARWHRRSATPDGVNDSPDGAPLYIQRNDPDVAQLLGIGAYAKPAVG